GGAFFLLTRYEEEVLTERDEHGRFPAALSLAARERFLDRPLVNEYAELLWRELRLLWPRLDRRRREFRLLPSHDVDVPFCTTAATRSASTGATRATTTRFGSTASSRCCAPAAPRRGSSRRPGAAASTTCAGLLPSCEPTTVPGSSTTRRSRSPSGRASAPE